MKINIVKLKKVAKLSWGNTSITKTSYVDNGVAIDVEYCYEITAVYDNGESDPSNIDCAEPFGLNAKFLG